MGRFDDDDSAESDVDDVDCSELSESRSTLATDLLVVVDIDNESSSILPTLMSGVSEIISFVSECNNFKNSNYLRRFDNVELPTAADDDEDSDDEALVVRENNDAPPDTARMICAAPRSAQ